MAAMLPSLFDHIAYSMIKLYPSMGIIRTGVVRIGRRGQNDDWIASKR